MKRRAFVKHAGKLLAVAPALLPGIYLTSCKKEATPRQFENGNLAVNHHSLSASLNNHHILNGYLDKQSYFPGDSCVVYLSADTAYTNQLIIVNNILHEFAFNIPVANVNKQQMQADNPSINGYGYTATTTITIPQIASGIYLIADSIPLIIKSKNTNVDFTIVYPSNTENAYCLSGGYDLYSTPPIQMVSFLRPIPWTYYASGFFKWVIQQSYTYNVIADIDVDDATNINGSLLIITGHSEYWTKLARQNFDAHVNSGKHALVLSGNTMYWHVRYNAEGNQMICYKAVEDPTPNPLDKTVIWAYKSQQYPPTQSIGVDGENGGYGIQSTKSFQGIKIHYPASPLFAGLDLYKGYIIPCSTHEYDAAPIAGYDSDGFPIIDNETLSFSQVQLIGYDTALDYFTANKFNTVTALMFKKNQSSGVVINMATTNWCTNLYFTEENNQIIPAITRNAIDGLLNNKDMFNTTTTQRLQETETI